MHYSNLFASLYPKWITYRHYSDTLPFYWSVYIQFIFNVINDMVRFKSTLCYLFYICPLFFFFCPFLLSFRLYKCLVFYLMSTIELLTTYLHLPVWVVALEFKICIFNSLQWEAIFLISFYRWNNLQHRGFISLPKTLHQLVRGKEK